ncbi:uncharacterized protein BDR25DRAFT_359982 [Lindgomyces ingoldianus]|uniref:Uncharacterized protein n=1 Tax=Lindgomyces ingoldianus TaxID=673940 RepID=A0ACB6QJ92_9PLEO|nr:uncharacterized protein BDR25DRAFT_359982 [Lindgomyces ingoldianus]KAF2466205.1 hypothetical protein BDR25DRAFT_359982 [Lindgomyces ingoldianus]
MQDLVLNKRRNEGIPAELKRCRNCGTASQYGTKGRNIPYALPPLYLASEIVTKSCPSRTQYDLNQIFMPVNLFSNVLQDPSSTDPLPTTPDQASLLWQNMICFSAPSDLGPRSRRRYWMGLATITLVVRADELGRNIDGFVRVRSYVEKVLFQLASRHSPCPVGIRH